jgi:hypothetical protein
MSSNKYNELYFSLKNKYNGELNPYLLSDDQVLIIKIFPWGFIYHDNIVIQHVAWRVIIKTLSSKQKWKLI